MPCLNQFNSPLTVGFADFNGDLSNFLADPDRDLDTSVFTLLASGFELLGRSDDDRDLEATLLEVGFGVTEADLDFADLGFSVALANFLVASPANLPGAVLGFASDFDDLSCVFGLPIVGFVTAGVDLVLGAAEGAGALSDLMGFVSFTTSVVGDLPFAVLFLFCGMTEFKSINVNVV